jgi:phosphoglycerate dehydrogenase-like enzyme
MAVVCLPEQIGAVDVAVAIRSEVALPSAAEPVFWHGDRLPARADEVEFLVLPPLFRAPELLGTFPGLSVVQTVSAGVDRVVAHIPSGVTLCDARGVHGGAVAEWALAATLSLVRELPRFTRAQDAQRWDTSETDELADKRALVLGSGDLGVNVARRLEAFGVSVTMVARTARDGVHATSELPTLLPLADIVIVVVPLTAETTGMVDAEFLSAMPDGSVLVNAARGEVADTDAVLAELTSGRLRAALDVTDPEPLPAGHPLWRAPGLLLTPHVAGNVPGFPHRSLQLVRAQLERYLAGRPLENVVIGEY